MITSRYPFFIMLSLGFTEFFKIVLCFKMLIFVGPITACSKDLLDTKIDGFKQ